MTDLQEISIQPDTFNTKILLKCLIFIICYGKGVLWNPMVSQGYYEFKGWLLWLIDRTLLSVRAPEF